MKIKDLLSEDLLDLLNFGNNVHHLQLMSIIYNIRPIKQSMFYKYRTMDRPYFTSNVQVAVHILNRASMFCNDCPKWCPKFLGQVFQDQVLHTSVHFIQEIVQGLHYFGLNRPVFLRYRPIVQHPCFARTR